MSFRKLYWDALSAHIGSDPFVLFIDEINNLRPRISQRLALILRKYFIDPKNRQLVMTSHIPVVMNYPGVVAEPDSDDEADGGDDEAEDPTRLWSDSTLGLSNRSVQFLPMPQSSHVESLVQMDPLICRGITPSMAAYYGAIPGLIFAVCRQPTVEAPAT